MLNSLFQVIILIFSIIIHEYAHGWAANEQGDSTARHAGRLTLNPIPHIDPFGSILLPAILLFSGTPFVFGWAKPVPFNPNNLRDHRYGPAKVAAAGPLSNLAVALTLGLILRFFALPPEMGSFLATAVYINILLAVFNALPIPPLDGSKIIAPFLPRTWQEFLYRIEDSGMILVLLFVIFGFSLITPVVITIFSWIVGS